MQAKLLSTNPLYWEILVFASRHHDIDLFTVDDLAKHFAVALPEMHRLVDDLYEYGLIDFDAQRRCFTKEWLYVPSEQEYHELREVNFKRSLDKFLQRDPDCRYRTTITRLVTVEQDREIQSYVDALLRWVIDLPDQNPPKAVPYTIGAFAPPRGFGNA